MTVRSWPFDLGRFNTPPSPDAETDPHPGSAPAGDTPADQPSPADELAAARADVEKWKALARRHEDRAKANAAKAKRLDDLEADQATDLDKARTRAEQAEQRAAELLTHAVTAEVRALAAATWAEPADAPLYLTLDRYLAEDGAIDTNTITRDLAEVLKAKPHLAKAEPKPRGPAPDPSQGPQLDTPASFATADRDQFAGELAKYGLRPRS